MSGSRQKGKYCDGLFLKKNMSFLNVQSVGSYRISEFIIKTGDAVQLSWSPQMIMVLVKCGLL